MKRRTGHRGFGLGIAAGTVTALALLPLYGDPRPSPVTHPEWARMILRALDLLDNVPLAAQASQVFSTLSWKNSLSYRADRYTKGAGITVMGDEPARRVLASAEVGEVSYPVAVARGGDYRVRLLLAGSPSAAAETEIRAFGEDKPQKVFTVPVAETAAWADAGHVHLDPGSYSATVLLPKGTTLEYLELAPPCLNPIEPLGGWKPTALATTGEVDLLTSLARHLAEMAGAARSVLSLGIGDLLDVRIGGAQSSAEGRSGGQVKRLARVDVDARGPDRIVEQHLPEKALLLGRPVARIHAAVGLPRQRDRCVVGGDLQLLEATDLLVNELAQLGGAGAVVVHRSVCVGLVRGDALHRRSRETDVQAGEDMANQGRWVSH